MTTFRAVVLADSINAVTHSRLTTMLLTYPRTGPHAELMTYRRFARNAASSRAIPAKRMRAAIRADMFVPLFWGENKPGMQAGDEIAAWRRGVGKTLWIALGHLALFVSACLDKLGVHKQIVNRITEPWSHITVVFTGTDDAYAQFYDQRRHHMAEPHIRRLADVMAAAHRGSVPRVLHPGQWHMPYVDDDERRPDLNPDRDALCHSVARVARTSYNKPDTGKRSTWSEDYDLHAKLVGATPMHASPAEHQAECTGGGFPNLAGCFGPASGWVQYRKTLKGEVTQRTLTETIQ